MAKPVLVVVDDEDASRQALARVLESRYGADYRIVPSPSPELALARLAEFPAQGVAVPLVLADHDLESLAGAGVFYGASTIEAQAVAGKPVFVVGGGNSAGQAALHLARYAEQVTLAVRSGSLSASMSDYLTREIGSAANVHVRYRSEVAGGGGDGRLEHLLIRDRDSGRIESMPAAGLFILIGAQPFTSWLPGAIARDRWGFILTGQDAAPHWPLPRAPFLFETATPGVFAVGDVRHGSVKRVASAVGEGSVVIRLVHDYLALRGLGQT